MVFGLSGAEATVSKDVATHYDALVALKAAIKKAGKMDKEMAIGEIAPEAGGK